RTNRSRLGQIGSSGSKRRKYCQRVKATGARAIGVPGCPEFAACTASIDRVRMVLIASWSGSVAGMISAPCLSLSEPAGISSSEALPRVVPSPARFRQVIGLGRPPRPRLVQMDGTRVAENRLYDAPRLLHTVFPRKEGWMAVDRITEQAFIRVHSVDTEHFVVRESEIYGACRNLATRHLRLQGDADALVPTAEPKPQVVRMGNGHVRVSEEQPRRLAELHDGLETGRGEALSGPNVEGHPGPAPGFDGEPERHIRFHRGFRVYVRLFTVPHVLAAHDLRWVDRARRAKDPYLLVALVLRVDADGRFHGKEGDDLEQVILNDIPKRAHLFVEPASAVDAEILRHRDLHVGDVSSIPDRLQQPVREPKDEEVLYRFFSQEVVDPIDRLLWVGGPQAFVQLPGGREVAPKGLLDDDPRSAVEPGCRDATDHALEDAGGYRQIEHGMRVAAQRLGEPIEGRSVLVVALQKGEPLREPIECHIVDRAESGDDRRPSAVPKLGIVPLGPPHADDGHVETVALRQVVQGGQQLLEREIAGRAEEDDGICSRRKCCGRAEPKLGDGWRRRHGAPAGDVPGSSATTAWPPNSLRIIASILSANVSSWRLRNRANSEAAITVAGTSSSMAASTVQRPSPV